MPIAHLRPDWQGEGGRLDKYRRTTRVFLKTTRRLKRGRPEHRHHVPRSDFRFFHPGPPGQPRV